MVQRQPDRVVIINDRSEKVGGASNLAILSARLLEEHGVKVTYFAGDDSTQEKPTRDTINLNGRPLVQQGKFGALRDGLYNRKAYDVLQGVIKTTDTPTTLYHLHGWSKILSPSIFRALENVRERTILHAHDYFLACPNGGFANYQTHDVCELEPMSRRCLATQCDKRNYHQKVWRSARHMLREHFYPTQHEPANIVTVHEAMREYLIRAGINVENVETIRNPIEPFLCGGGPSTHKSFYFIGRLEPEKGFEDAAKAARLADITLHVIGDGAGRSILEKDYPEVVIHGWHSHQSISSLVRDARALIVSSRVPEPFGLAALEAVSSGIPVIIPDSALLANEISTLECGQSFHAGNIDALAEVIRRLAANDALVRKMSSNCLREAPALAHSTASWGNALMEFYERVLDRSAQTTSRSHNH